MRKLAPQSLLRWFALAWYLVLGVPAAGFAADTVDAYYEFQNYTASPLNVRRVTITPIGPSAEYGSAFLSQKPIVYSAATYPSLTNGYLLATNLLTGYAYRAAFSDGYGEPTVTNYFGTNLSGTVGAVTNKTSYIEWSNGRAVQINGPYFNATLNVTNYNVGGGSTYTNTTDLPGVVNAGNTGIGTNISTLYVAGQTLNVAGNELNADGSMSFGNGAGSLTPYGDLTLRNITASQGFHGDGSGLTNISTGTTYTNSTGLPGVISGSAIGTNLSTLATTAGLAAGTVPVAGGAVTGSVSNALYTTNLIAGTPVLGARSTRKPRLGLATYLTVFNGTNLNAGGGTNLYCNPNEHFILHYMTNAIEHGLLKLGYDSICIEEGWQGAVRMTDNTNNFPRGIPWLIRTAKSMGFKIGLYTDLTYQTCCGYWGSGGTNTIDSANLFASWGVDYIHADTCGQFNAAIWPTDVYGPWSETARRRQYEDFQAALRATNSNIGLTMNMNATPYQSWIGQSMNGWQLAPNGDGPTYWSALESIEWADLAAGQFRQGHTPSWYPFNYSILSGGTDSFGNGYYGAGMLTVGGAAMWQSELQFPTDMIALESFAPGSGAVFMTNQNILRINQDSLFIPPTKSFTNGTIDVWTKPLEDGTTAMLVFNKGYSAALTFTNLTDLFGFPGAGGKTYSVPQVTSNNITIPASSFGYLPGEQATFTQVLAGTNFTGSSITIPCPSNHCTLWIVSSSNPKKIRGDLSDASNVPFGTNYIDLSMTYAFDSTTVEGTGVSAITHTSYGPSPFFSRAGLVQSAANSDATFVVKDVPVWATNATVVAMVYSAFAGGVAWTNKPYLEWTYPTGRNQLESNGWAGITNTPVVTTSGTATYFTNNLYWPRTNAPKTFKIVMLASTNSSARYVLGPINITWRGTR